VALADVEAEVRAILTQPVVQLGVAFVIDARVPARADGGLQGLDGRLGVEVVPVVFGHAGELGRVLLEVGEDGDFEARH
jgi:hypothetical protein